MDNELLYHSGAAVTKKLFHVYSVQLKVALRSSKDVHSADPSLSDDYRNRLTASGHAAKI